MNNKLPDAAREIIESVIDYEAEFSGQAFRKSRQGHRLIKAIAAWKPAADTAKPSPESK